MDVGGTFTDFLLVRSDGSVLGEKTPSTPPDFSAGILIGLRQLAAAEALEIELFLRQTDLIVHGTTAVTNALLTRSGARTAVLTTRGFRDALEMRRGVKERIYDNKDPAPLPVVPRERRLPINERTLYDGTVVQPIEPADVRGAAASLREAGVEAVAICFLHAYADPSNEEGCRRIVEEELPDAFVTTSAALLPKIGFYDRLSTTVVNAYAGPLLAGYVDRLRERLARERFQGTLLVMLSSGGVADAAVAARIPAAAVGSGPAGGAIAGMRYATEENQRASVTFDMGGTSLDLACVLGGRVGRVRSTDVNRVRVAMPMVDVVSVGAGGGSLARVDAGGLLHVGPESAGADPGPAAYGRGGDRPTVTDANLLLGFLNPVGLLGGRVPLDATSAAKAIEIHVAKPLGISPQEAALGIFEVINASMGSAVREFLYERGQDPKEFSLVAAGGAGPLHAAHVARDLGIRTVVVPRDSALFSSVGLLVANLKHDFVQTFFAPVRELDSDGLRAVYNALRARGRAVLDEEGIAPDQQRFEYSADLRYERQIHEIEVPMDLDMLDANAEALEAAFAARHREAYGYELPGSLVEFINARVSAIGETPDFWFPDAEPAKERVVPEGARPMILPATPGGTEVAVYDVDRLAPGSIVQGAAMVEGARLSLLVPGRSSLSVNRWGDFVIQVEP